jgi:hypothetical protein
MNALAPKYRIDRMMQINSTDHQTCMVCPPGAIAWRPPPD